MPHAHRPGATPPWPADLPVAAVRFARATSALEECRAFYQGLLGLELLAEFRDHDGYDGCVLGLPDRSTQLELVRGPDGPEPSSHPENALVLYAADGGAALRARLAGRVTLLEPDNPYWVRLGAFAVEDPDGWQVIVAPASDLEDPVDEVDEVGVEEFDGDRRELDPLFRLAEDSETALADYRGLGRVWVARRTSGEVVGHLQAVVRDGGSAWEILNTAVVEAWQGRGVGSLLLDRAVTEARRAGAARLEVATATADVGNLRFYQRCGMRMSRVVQDRFGPENGYPEGLEVEGIPLRDQVWFERRL